MQPVCLSCPVCLALTPNRLPITQWQFHVAENQVIECRLPFDFAALDIASEHCYVCSIIKDGIVEMSRGVFRDELQGLSQRKGHFIVQRQSPLEAEISGREENGNNSVRMQFFVGKETPATDINNVFGNALNIAPRVSSGSHKELIHSWISKCIQNHKACRPNANAYLPTRLLDIQHSADSSVSLIVTKNCRNILKYATLSHCWGKTHFIKTTTVNIESFKNGIPFTSLPRTFQDAITVAQGLDISHIWIDSLCILQDSPEDWNYESTRMASVYSNSYLNIAATGSSDSSRPFLLPRRPRHASVAIPRSINLDGGGQNIEVSVRASLDQIHKLYSTPGKNSTWESNEAKILEAPLLSRAWVFQERHLAPRTLHFHPSELVLECRTGLNCECGSLDHFPSNPLRNFDNMSFSSWFGIVEDFSRLKLTYSTDRLSALNGVAKVFQEALGCSYMKGIWENDIARGILWDVTKYEYSTELTTRQGKDVAPTWSWASMVPSEGNKIFFPAGDEDSFTPDSELELLSTNRHSGTFESQLGDESSELWVKGRFIDAIICSVIGIPDQRYESLLIMGIDVGDAVLITTLHFGPDIPGTWEEIVEEPTYEVTCLHVGSMEEKEPEINSTNVYYCMLILRASNDSPGAWERVGVLDMMENIGINRPSSVREFKLV